MFNKKFSKKATGIIIGAFALTCAAIGGITAAACDDCGNNWPDTEGEFVFNANMATDCYTKCREKNDNTKVYVSCTSSDYGFYVKPYGTYMKVNPRNGNEKSEDCSYGECAKDKGAWLEEGRTKYLQNTVNEKGYPRVYLYGQSSNVSRKYKAEFVWSPDNYNHK